ncbi:MAG: SDR family oxidoreductase [Hyphomicrobiales bacterium]
MSQKTILITGANRGIGLELVKCYLNDGWNVHATCRDPGSATELKALACDELAVHALEVTEDDAIFELAHALKGVPFDILLNNAGVMSKDRPARTVTDRADWLHNFNVNSISPLAVAGAFMENLKDGGGIIATVSSRMGSNEASPAGGAYAYRASKAAVNKVMSSLAAEIAEDGVYTILFHPGWVQTDMGGSGADIDAQTSAAGMKQVLDGFTPEQTGKFFSFDGAPLPW